MSMVAREAFLRYRKNAACSSGLSWICCRLLIAIRARLLSRAAHAGRVTGRCVARKRLASSKLCFAASSA